jgi:L-glutamine-phosphate cytidylyltransferase
VRGVILAAGRGRRMGAATSSGPKCLLEVGGRTLLDRQVAALRAAGVDEVGVVVGWHAERFADPGDVTVLVNGAWARTTMVGSLAVAGPWLRSAPVVAAYGDIVFTAATARALAAADEALAVAYDPAWYAMWSLRSDAPLEDAETFRLDRAGRLIDIGGRPASATEDGQYIGLLKVTPAGWGVLDEVRLDAGEDADLTAVLRRIVAGGLVTVGAVAVQGSWWEFDTGRDLELGRAAAAAVDREEQTAREVGQP